MNRELFYKFTFFYIVSLIVFALLIRTISIDFKATIVWLVISFFFYPLIVFSFFSKHKSLQFFIGALFLAHSVGSPLFFIQKDNYEVTGFSAVRNFDFNVISYLKINFYVFLFLYTTVFSTIMLKKMIPTGFIFRIKEFKKYDYNNSNLYTIILFFFIILMSQLNYWMFNNSIGLTGIESPRLPFKLSGILYFFSRFVSPILILYLYSKLKRNLTITFVIMVYALWAAICSVSRTTLTMYWLPVLFYAILDRKYVLLSISVFLFFTIFPFIEYARNYVYQIDDGIVGMNISSNLFNIAEELINTKDIVSIKDALFSFVGRLGGTQDIVLADQYNNTSFGTNFLEFTRVFFLSKEIDILKVQGELYGFSPPEGFSPGDGAIAASVLIISGKNFFYIILVSFFISIIIHFNEILLVKISKLFNYSELIFFLALLFNIIFVPRLSMLWLYGYFCILLLIIFFFKYTFLNRFIIK